MQEVFEKIISKINEKIEHYDSRHKILTDSGMFGEADRIAERMVELDFVREIVKHAATDYNNGWIPVSDHIPVPAKKSFGNKQKRTNVLVTLRNGLVKEMTFEFETNEFWEAGDNNHIEHWKEDVIDTDVEVIAWQPLPLPYTNGE